MEPLARLTLSALLERSLANFAHEPLMGWVGEQPITFEEFGQAVAGLSTHLEELGITKGDAVAILSENCPNWGIAYFAITTMGAIAVPILPEFHADAVHHIIRHSEARAVFVSEKLFNKLEDGAFDSEPQFLLMDTFQTVERDAGKDRLKELKAAGLREFRRLSNRAIRFAKREDPDSAPDIQEDDTAAIIYTSGTTGHSKGVMLSHRNIVFNADAVKHIVHVAPGDRMLSILPLSHTYECTLGLVLPVMFGSQIHYLDKPPTARALLPAMAKVQPTIMLSVPLVIEKIFKTAVLPKLTGSWLKQRLYRIPAIRKKLHAVAGKKLLVTFGGCLKIFCIGGAALAPDVERFLKEAGFPYAIGYGLTETSPLLAGDPPDKVKLYSTGRALEGVELKIVDADPATGEGEIIARGPNVMQGYYKAPEITKSVLDEEGWFRTGDLGKMDKDDYLYIKGRLKNVIVGASGENIYPEEIEAVINQSSWVLECLVLQQDSRLCARVHIDYSKVDEEYGDLPAQKQQQKVDELLENIKKDVNSSVSSFARLHKIYEQTEPFEKTPTHKIKRYLYVN